MATTKKTTATTKKAATKKEQATATTRDKWGCREGSQAATINACITNKPKPVASIVEETGLDAGRVRAHIKHLTDKGLVEQVEAGVKTAKAK